MTTYGTIPTSSSQGTNDEFIPNAEQQVKVRIFRPWKEMVRSLSLPSGFHNTIERIKTNLVYFRSNYLIILWPILFLNYLYNPAVWLSVFLELLAIVIYSVFCNIHMGLIFCLNVLMFTFDDEAAWYIISTLLIEAVVVVAHASVRKTDDLSLDEGMPLASGIPNGRPWKEMARSLNFPSGFRNTIERMKTNLGYFKINYVIILMLILFLSFLCHWLSLSLSLTLFTYVWLLLYYFCQEPPIYRRLAIVLGLNFIVLMFITDAAWNIISTLLIEAVVVAAHASLRKTDDLFVDEELAQTATLLTSSSS